MLTMFFKFFLSLTLFSTALTALPTMIGPDVRKTLIRKLERIYKRLPAGDEVRGGMALRIADLLAQEGRYKAMKELETGCVQCSAGDKERGRAVEYYREGIVHLPKGQKPKVFGQLGHLYELTGRQNQAAKYYRLAFESPDYSNLGKADAALSLGELYFRQGLYQNAITYYDFVLETKGFERRPLAAYRRAWSYFNGGEVTRGIKALTRIMKTKDLLVRGGSGDKKSVEQYRSELSKDLATFMAKAKGKMISAKTLYRLSPSSSQSSNLSYLASELERTGQRSKALEVYLFAIEKEKDSEKKLALFIRTAFLQREAGAKALALAHYEKALALWASKGCKGSECKEWKSRLRKFILDWHEGESKSPSENLVSSYRLYAQTFPNEMDMKIWWAKALEVRKDFEQVYKVYGDVIALMLSGKGTKGANNKNKLPSLESLLLARIEAAEKRGEGPFLDEAYAAYREHSKEKSQDLTVRYQQVYRIYKKGQYEKAAVAFREIASSKSPKSLDLKKKAADLALDSLVLLKDEGRLRKWSLDFAALFPESGKEYRNINRKSLFNLVASTAQNDLIKSWEALGEIDLKEAGRKERIDYYRNKLVLAEKLKKFPEARKAADNLLGFKGLSQKDSQFALSRKAWLAEMFMDFGTALKVTERLRLAELSAEEKTLKLALLAELSGQKSTPYYRRYLRQVKDRDRAYAVALKLVQDSKTPLKELLKQRKILGRDKNKFASMYLSEIAKQGGKVFRKHSRLILKNKDLAKTPTGQFLWRRDFISNYQNIKKKIEKHKISHKT
ncbi:MAG: hypothetical protein OXB88_09145 [Bacteriovoracales bacterium]|nr:hypothetical protein [Bacteriovoracales bacterium]